MDLHRKPNSEREEIMLKRGIPPNCPVMAETLFEDSASSSFRFEKKAMS